MDKKDINCITTREQYDEMRAHVNERTAGAGCR